MRRLALFAAIAAAIPGAADAQRVEIDAARTTSFQNPILTRPGELIASEISATDFRMTGNRRTEQFAFPGRAGEVVTAQVRSDLPDIEVVIMNSSFSKVLARGPAKDAPLRVTLSEDATFYLMVASKGALGKYLLSLGSGDTAPPFDPPKPAPAPVQVAEKPKPAPPPAATPKTPSASASPVVMPRLAPPPGVLSVEIGKTLSRPAGKTPGAQIDLYQFIGEAGAVLQADAAGGGRYGLTLYTPEGVEMLTATGAGSAKLVAVLPKDAVYLLAVTRQDAAKPYKLSLTAEAPDLHQWNFREGAGYELLGADGQLRAWSCWTVPGSALRFTFADGQTRTQTVQRGGVGRWDFNRDGKPAGYAFSTRIEGDKFIRTRETGETSTWSLGDPGPTLGTYRGYLCR